MSEPAFMIGAVRRFLNPREAAPDPRGIDWKALIELGQAHAVTPMLHATLGGNRIPAMQSAMEGAVRRSMAQIAELTRVNRLFAQRGIPAIALKGPVLSQYLYGDPASRASGDIDFLARPEHVAPIHDVLVAEGFRLHSAIPWNGRSAFLRSRENQLSFVSPSGMTVDIHWRLLPAYFASAFDQLDPWTAVRTETIAGREVQSLAPPVMLLFLCSHGAKHMFERLGWLCDIARFLIVTPDLDWPAVIEPARRAHALRQLLLGVRLAVDLLGAPPPPSLPEDPVLESLAARVHARLLAGARPPAPALESTGFCLRMLERPNQRLRLLHGLYLSPSAAEYKVLRLPPALYFLYYPFRPVRLLWKHASFDRRHRAPETN
jgi:hypothetical protein